jgi:PAS domain S-box-containing protein
LPPPDPKSLVTKKLAALRSEAGLVTILDGIGEGFYAVDCDWRILLFNSEASRHFRCKPEDVIGRILWEVFPGTRDTGLAQLFHKVMASRESIRSETESIVHKGRWMAYRLFPVGDGLGVVFRDTTDRRVAEEQRDLLIKELEHRVKNTLTIVQSIAAQTFRHSKVDPAVQRAFEGRLITLSNVQAVLTQQSWDSAELHEVVRSALRAHGAPGEQHFRIEGPELQLSPQSAVALSMAVHELATNAIKYGALSAEAGHVDIGWSISDGRFRWSWRERGGPRVKTPKRKGFGSRMIERALALQLSGKVAIDYAPAGVACTIDAPLEAMGDGAIAERRADS